MKEIDRNSTKAIESDVSFIQEIRNMIRSLDYESVITCLSDWELELKDQLIIRGIEVL